MFRKLIAIITLFFSIVFMLVAQVAQADDLLQVYRAALKNNPAFKKAQADWLAFSEELPIALTGTGQPGSGLFTYASFNALGGQAYDKTTFGNTVLRNGHFGLGNYFASITQPIFNYATWKSISRASFTVKAATARYLFAAQDLMFTVVNAYFTVLRAYNNVQIIVAKRRKLFELLGVAKYRVKIGLDDITDVYDVESRYYRALTQEQAAEQVLKESIEALEAVTGVRYTILRDFPKRIPLAIPQPQNQSEWVRIAQDQNYQIHADLYAMLAAREKIKETAAAGMPTLNAQIDFENLNEGRTRGPVPVARRRFVANEVGLELKFPFLQGGHVLTTTRQAEYQYLSASDQLEFTRYEVRRTTGQAFVRIDQEIKQIKSGYNAILASQEALKASEISYLVGNRVMLDVVINAEELYDTILVWNNNRNDYIINLIQLKQQAGTLSPRDLVTINRWLLPNVVLRSKSSSPSVAKYFKMKTSKLEKSLMKIQDKEAVQSRSLSKAKLLPKTSHKQKKVALSKLKSHKITKKHLTLAPKKLDKRKLKFTKKH
ncbi:TolC family protein [Candidiatus Paracoxiella cheracis]|uniref:TolC family protein n=1 Tax=Candidiatus Paracoxiella cheracis TaxID=3405120 RepID=UPI003BF56F5F